MTLPVTTPLPPSEPLRLQANLSTRTADCPAPVRVGPRQMPILNFFFGFNGRVGRLAFAVGSTVASIIASVAIVMIGGNPFGTQPTLLLGAAALLLSVPMWALTVKRCHDLGMTGWWAIPPLASLPLAAHATELLTAATRDPGLLAEASMLAGIAAIACLASMWLTVKLCFFVGASGSNAFGPERTFAQSLFGDGTGTAGSETGPSWADTALATASAAPTSEAAAVRRAQATIALGPARQNATPAFGRRR